ncbi:MAG: cytochrome c [Myxococcales bacterium]|nr:cytochrome c [Myxococcales bacterium]
MKRTVSFALALFAVACQSGSSSPPTAESSKPPPPAAPAAPAKGPEAMLDAMDSRTAVPLIPMMANHQKQNMRDHLLAVQEITLALAKKDWDTVEKSAARISSSPQMTQMCTHMGAGAPGFTEAGLSFHSTADGIAKAAKDKDSAAVLTALGKTLETCTGCHSRFKQRIVDEATWTSLTKQAAPTHPMH